MNPILIGLICLGCLRGVNGEVHRFERLAATALSSRLMGESKHVSVQADVGPEALFGDVHRVMITAGAFSSEELPFLTEPKRSQRGFLREFVVDMTDFRLRGLHVDQLHLDIPDSRFDFAAALHRNEFHLTRSGMGTANVTISQADLAAFIRRKYPNVKDVELRIDGDKLFLDGRAVFLGASTHFSVVARLETTDGVRLNLARARILLEGRPAEPALADLLVRTINPVVDLNADLGLEGAVRVEAMVLRNGVLKATGKVVIPTD